jgi:hypothetical protein
MAVSAIPPQPTASEASLVKIAIGGVSVLSEASSMLKGLLRC